MILLPKYKELILPVRGPAVGVRGFYKIEARGADGRMRTLADWFPNLITTLGANALGSATSNVFSACYVGSGNTAPAVTDTALQSLIGGTSTINTQASTPPTTSPYFGTCTTQFNFAAGVATGNLSEVGVGNASNALFSRALILDSGGTPTTITVLSSESLYVTYAFSMYAPLTDTTGTVVVAGVSYGYTGRAANVTGGAWAPQVGDTMGIFSTTVFNGTIGAITSSPSGSNGTESSHTNNSYSTGSFTLSGTSTFDLTHGNLSGGVTALLVTFGQQRTTRGQYQFGLGAAIPKDGSHILTLTFSQSWVINSP